MNIIIKEYCPATDLCQYVEFFWEGKFNISADGILSQKVVPNGCVELIIHLNDLHCELLQGKNHTASPEFTLIGLFTKPYDVHFKGAVNVFGIRFKPEGLYPVFGVQASELTSSFADMELIAGRHFRDFCRQLKELKTTQAKVLLTESFLQKRLSINRKNQYYLNFAADIIRKRKGLISMEALSAEVFISTRQLEREFKQKIGISPKQYMRIARLNGVQRLIENNTTSDFTNISYEGGYADQAHFIREFKSFTGESPKAFVKKRKDFIVNNSLSTSIHHK